jgi:N-acyl-L-homoserine lactone synthetase
MDSRLCTLDALAKLLLTRAAPVQFDVAASHAEHEAAYRLRFDTVVEEGWATAADFSDGLERDAFDARAVQVLGRRDGRLIAVARLVLPEHGRALPTELEFELTMQPIDRVVDIGRAIIVKDYRSAEHTLFGALLARCWLEIRARGYQNLCGAASSRRLERYRQFGLPLRILGPSRRYWGEVRYPVFLDGEEFADFVQKRGFMAALAPNEATTPRTAAESPSPADPAAAE